MGASRLAQVLRGLALPHDERLLVGLATGDDAGVYQIGEGTALVQTVDFFTPIVDDPYQYGQIAAANSMSDIYAMGGRPITAMNILCYPIGTRDPEELAGILRGGAEKVEESGAALVGGHSVEDDEPKYGLAVTGIVDPEHVATNAGAQPGDMILLTKPLGTGIITTAAKFDECPKQALDAASQSMSELNAAAARAMNAVGIGPEGVHAATDITGYGLLGHLWNIARESSVMLTIESDALPILPEAERLAAAGNVTRGERENAEFLGDRLWLKEEVSPTRRSVMLDPQTSGGLAIFVAAARMEDLVAALDGCGVGTRAVIGRASAGSAGIVVN